MIPVNTGCYVTANPLRVVHKVRQQSGGGGLSSANKGNSSDADVRTFWCKISGFF